MTAEIKLTRGNTSLNLTEAPYSVGMDFAPPAVNPTYNIGSGTSANRTGGGKLISYRANNRQFTFSVRLLASDINAAGAYARRVSSFLETKTADALYLEYRENSSIPVPIWGQFGAPIRYEIVTEIVGSPNEQYTNTTGRGFFLPITLEISPYAEGLLNGVMNSSGAVYQDNLGTINGFTRGLRVCEATTNKLVSPTSFIIETVANGNFYRNYEFPQYLWPGDTISGGYVTATAANCTLTKTINVGNTNSHTFAFYVCRTDFEPVTVADCAVYYAATKSSIYTAEGNGIYRVEWTGAGIASNQSAGLKIENGRSLYILGGQIEEKAYHTPLAEAKQLGCVGASSAVAAVRTAGWCHTPVGPYVISGSNIGSHGNDYGGAASIVWRPDYANTAAGDRYLLSTFNPPNAQFYFNATDDKFYLSDGTNSISSAAQTFAEHDVLALVITWGETGLNIYKNGANIATGASYRGISFGTSPVFLGSNDTPANHAGGVFMGFDMYGEELTAAQVTAMYQTMQPIIASDNAVSLIPTATSVTGAQSSGQTLYYSEDATHSNNTVVHGVPGSAAARTVISINPTGAEYNAKGHYISLINMPLNRFARALLLNYTESANGTGAATSSGAYYEDVSVGSAADVEIKGLYIAQQLAGRDLFVVFRFNDAGANLTTWIKTTADISFANAARATNDLTAFTFEKTNQFSVIPYQDRMIDVLPFAGNSNGLTYTLMGRRTTGGASNVSFDFAVALSKPCMKINPVYQAFDDVDLVVYDSKRRKVAGFNSSSQYIADVPFAGDVIEVIPNEYNMIIHCLGEAIAEDAGTDVYDYRIMITPRYTLL
jgi:hypothetical protein